MTDWQTQADWLNANEWTSFPFASPTPVDRYLVDGLFTLGQQLAADDLIITLLRPANLGTREIHGQVGSTTVFDGTSIITTRSWGAYEIWEIQGLAGSGLLVVDPLVEPAEALDDPQGVPVAVQALNYLNDGLVLSVAAGAQEAAGPGQYLTFLAGQNIEVDWQETADGPRLTIGARYAGGGCTPELRPPPALQTINGRPPNEWGDFQLLGGGCYSVRIGPSVGTTQVQVKSACTGSTSTVDVGPSYQIQLENHCRACCDCQDYVRLFEWIKLSHERLQVLNRWLEKNKQLYQQQLVILKSILGAEGVGSRYEELGGDPCGGE